jgi:hypothetical protein
MKLHHPAVFLFGAGATRGGLEDNKIPPPVDTDFFDIAGQVRGHGTPNFAKSVLRDVWALYRRISGVSLEAYYRDIETREKIDTFAKSRHRPKDWQRRRRTLEELIRRIIIHTTCDTTAAPHAPRVSKHHKTILKELQEGDTLLTFNYDTVIEEAFDSADKWSPVDGYGPEVFGRRLDWARKWLRNRRASSTQESRILLIKLHGSLSWELYRTKKVRMKPRPYVVRPGKRETISILPPGWDKEIARNPYKQLWQQARSRLESCKSLIVIGYSLPETDLLARALFAEVVRRREVGGKHLKQLHIADPSATTVQRLLDLFNPALGAQGHVFRYSGGIREFADKLTNS